VITAYETILSEVKKHSHEYEIIFVDDGSNDDSFVHITKVSEKDPNVKALKFASNCGSHMAIRAGLEYATGDCACFIACDMQEPPELIYRLLKELEEPYEIVWAVRNSRKDSFSSILFAKVFYFFARRMVSKNIPPSGASMFMISKKALKSLNKYNERNLTLEGLFATIGFKSKHVLYEREMRKQGKSKWTLAKKIKLFIDFFIAYSYTPIRIVSITGVLLFIIGLIWTAYIIIRQLVWGDLSAGWPALLSVLLTGFGITNISLGIIAEYLWRTLDETRKRPRYILEKTINLTEKND
jgi:dolichol-phosphate mannosyltransferase